MSKFCLHCGAATNPQAKFCSGCGRSPNVAPNVSRNSAPPAKFDIWLMLVWVFGVALIGAISVIVLPHIGGKTNAQNHPQNTSEPSSYAANDAREKPANNEREKINPSEDNPSSPNADGWRTADYQPPVDEEITQAEPPETANESPTANVTDALEEKYHAAHQLFFEAQNYAASLPTLRELANQGHAQAQYTLGYAYYYGLGVEENESVARQWFEKAAAQGNADAQAVLQLLAANDTPTNTASAATNNRIAGTYEMVIFHEGKEVDKTTSIIRVTDDGEVEIIDQDRDRKIPALYDHQTQKLTVLVKQDDIISRVQVKFSFADNPITASGTMTMEDIGEGKKVTADVVYTKISDDATVDDTGLAMRRKIKAKYDAASKLYLIDNNYAAAIPALRELAEQGHADAQCLLGMAYSSGNGVEEDLSIAAQWYKKSAEQGDAGAQSMLGNFYKNGYGVEKNLAEAEKWYLKSAEQGDAHYQFMCGNFYESEAKNLTEAAKWYLRAAEQQEEMAQHRLVHFYLDGKGVTKNRQEAKRWFDKLETFKCDDCKKIQW